MPWAKGGEKANTRGKLTRAFKQPKEGPSAAAARLSHDVADDASPEAIWGQRAQQLGSLNCSYAAWDKAYSFL